MQKSILIINGSASANSSNERLVERIADRLRNEFNVTVYADLKTLPHFDPALSDANPPPPIANLRNEIHRAAGVIICTPEYIFSIPSGLKNAIEWCVATTIFTDKPLGIVTASLHGQKGHDELQLIMKTVMAKFTDDTTWLIQGVKGKINERGEITNETTKQELVNFTEAFRKLVISSSMQTQQ
ncbi:MAG TPA: NADPH-dependent FMN reductase [Cyclobacteriaceae bacterium]|nr:NADPH-dependent FMN reductase [Cyclobacteriaceae bacterium]